MKPSPSVSPQDPAEKSDPTLWYASLFAIVVMFLGAVLWRGFAESVQDVGSPLSALGTAAAAERPVEAVAPKHKPGVDPHPELQKRHGRTDREAFAHSAQKRLEQVESKLTKLGDKSHAPALAIEVEEMNQQARNVSLNLASYDSDDCSVTQDEVEMSLSDLEKRVNGAHQQLSLAP